MLYDAAIIGTSPAGLSAVLTLKNHDKSFIWIGSRDLSTKISRAERITNYPGLTNVTGAALADAFRTQIEASGIEITEGVVTGVYPMNGKYGLTVGPEIYEAKTVLLATGVAAVAALPGEAELLGRGVSYCATCDGMLYRGRTVAVIAAGRRFEHEAAFLAGLAGKMYYFPGYRDPGNPGGNAVVMPQKVAAVLGGDRVSGVRLTDGSALDVDGVFCLRDSVSLAALLPRLALEDGHIAVDRNMATNLPGCFAAGDCTGRPYQYAKAAGEGDVAAHAIVAFLAEHGPA